MCDWEEIKRARKAKSKRSTPTKEESQGSYANSSSILTSQASQALTPPSGPLPEQPERPLQLVQKCKADDTVASDKSDDSDSSDSSSADIRPAASARKRPRGHRRIDSSLSDQQSSRLPEALLTSPPASREPSLASDSVNRDNTAHPEFVPRSLVATVELNPGPDFDPDDYARLSQLASQSQTWLRPPNLSQYTEDAADFASLVPADAPQTAASQSAASERADNQQHSAHTVPDSQEDSSAALYTTQEEPEPEPEATAAIASQSVPADLPSRQLDGDSSGHACAPAFLRLESQDNGQRPSADWLSERLTAPPTEHRDEVPVEAGYNSSGRSDISRFLTQLVPDFSLLAETPISSGPGAENYSVVFDSTQPNRTITAVAEAIVTTSSSAAAAAASTETLGRDPLLNSAQIVQPFLSNLGLHFTQQSSSSTSSDMDGDTQMSAVERLRQAHREALGDDFLTPIDDPLVLAEIRRIEQEREQAMEAQTVPPPPPEEYSGPSSSDVAAMAVPPVIETVLPIAPVVLDKPPLVQPEAGDTFLGAAPAAADIEVSGAEHIGSAIGELDSILHPATIAPADLSFDDPIEEADFGLSSEPEESADVAAIPADDDDDDILGDEAAEHVADDIEDDDDDEDNEDGRVEPRDSPVSMDDADHPDDLSASDNPNFSTYEYVVTLPLAANTRIRYTDIVMDKANQQTIKKFGAVFARDVAGVPDAETVGRVDDLLRKLLDLSDLPPFYDSLPTLPDEAAMKYAVDTNCKFSFVYEFLEAISTLDKTVLILARDGVALDMLEKVVSAAGISVQRLDPLIAATSAEAKRKIGSLSVILGPTSEAVPASLPASDAVDIVIGFDHTARTSGLLSRYLDASVAATAAVATAEDSAHPGDGKARRNALPKPVVMLLVAAFSLEHIDLRLELGSVDELERKNALLLCTLECLAYLQDMPFEESPAKPFEAAGAFAKMFTNPAKALQWKPVLLPEDAFDIYVQSSGATQPSFSQEESIGVSMSQSKKRQLVRSHPTEAKLKQSVS